MSEEKQQEKVQEEAEILEEEMANGEETVEEPDLEKELTETRAELAEQKDQVLRIAAEFENYKKRMTRERNAALKYAGEPIFREVLSVVDNLERALEHQKNVGEVEPEQALQSMLEGVELTLKSLLNSLEKFEVKPIESVGQPFDPNVQEALTMEASDTIPANHVVNEFEKGYYYKDRLLRAAKVIVSAGAGAAGEK